MNQETLLTPKQLEMLAGCLHEGATEAATALTRWVGRPTSLAIDSVRQLPLYDAVTVLGEGETPIGYCVTEMTGRLDGELILAFDDASGWVLADFLLNRPRGASTEWGEIETSAAMETTNIICCAYLNALSRLLPESGDDSPLILPQPPRMNHDFPESLVESALMGQVAEADLVLVATTQFMVDGSPLNWTLLFVPSAASMIRLRELLG